MSESGSQEIKSKFITGVVSLISRTIVVQIISFLATFALTVFLDPSVYGVFYLVSAVVNFLAYFSDIGLAASLIQKKEKITKDDLDSTFTAQQIIVFTLLILLFVATPLIKEIYHFDRAGILVLYSLGISLVLSSLKTIPSVLLERELKFEKLIIPQIIETLVYNLVAVIAAWQGAGIMAFAYAVLARGLSGLIAMYLISPYKPRLFISKTSLTGLLKFGVPYQANSLLAVFKDDGMTIFLGRVVGADGLGYLGWGSRWANLPLRVFMDNVTKVAFPAFARLQSDHLRLKKLVENSIKYLCLFTFPVLVAMGLLGRSTIELIPRYSKWLPALIPFYLYLLNAAFACVSTLLTNMLSAVGRIKTVMKLMIMWTVLTWGIMPPLALKYGYMGVGYATGIIALSSVVVFYLVKRLIKFSLIASLKTPVISSSALAIFLYFARNFVTSTTSLIAVCLASVPVFVLTLFLIEGRDFVKSTTNYLRGNV